jgi:hypothetical protein
MIKIVTAGDKNYKSLIDRAVDKATHYRADIIVYDLGGLGYGKPWQAEKSDFKTKEGVIPATFKPEVIKDASKYLKEFVWIDGDAYLNGDISEVFEQDFEIAVTKRTQFEVEVYYNDPKIGTINSGVVFFKNATEKFFDHWIKRTQETGYDQQALNEIYKEYHHIELPVLTYNDYHQNKGKIIHEKHQHRFYE